ncbi:MAG: glycogen/starch synthase [Saprospiraceae bacterium]|nr:glycogen/starch synthase [Saprospiraceae bacterium]
MEKKRLLLVTQDMHPYTALSEISRIAQQIPQYMHDNGLELRILMPRFGTINERRHRLHEVVRLSGMNIVVNDEDFPLIIKVASMPGSRLQVYFLDNDEFFKRKSVFEDAQGKSFADNMERMTFFSKGVIETVKKFGWPPDIIHCHGWMTSLVPFYLRTVYKDEPLFRNARMTYSTYNHDADSQFIPADLEKALVPPMSADALGDYLVDGKVVLDHGAVVHSDAIIRGSETLLPGVEQAVSSLEKPVLEFIEGEDMLASYLEFYHNLLEQEVQS